MTWRFLAALFFAAAFFGQAQARTNNFPDRVALVVNTSPAIDLGDFFFQNTSTDRRDRFEQHLSWKNIGQQPIVAFEIVVLKYDAFDQREVGSRWTVTGTNSANWAPLKPGETSQDGVLSYGPEDVFTAIAYVRSVRFADGTVWRVSDADLLQQLRKVAPNIKDFGNIKPDPKVKEAK